MEAGSRPSQVGFLYLSQYPIVLTFTIIGQTLGLLKGGLLSKSLLDPSFFLA